MNRMLARSMAPGASVALLALLWACGGGGPSTPPAPTPAPTPTPLPYIGNWFGTTSQRDSISFAVGQNGVTSLSLGYRAQGGGCNVTSATTLTLPTPSPVTGNSFQFSISTATEELSVRGTFSSTSAASGDFTYTTKGGACGDLSVTPTWTATKQ